MKCVVIGTGYFGKIILSKLKDHDVITVDPIGKSDYKSILDVPFVDGKWFVITPASTHYDILCTLFEKGVKDIWVEKPVCPHIDQTMDIFEKIPKDVFLFCDFTWLQHSVVKRIGDHVVQHGLKNINIMWLNSGENTPRDANIVVDLVIHPVSILYHVLLQTNDSINTISMECNKNNVFISGESDKNVKFTIEVSNSFNKKLRYISLISDESIVRWSSLEEYYIEGIGEVDTHDALSSSIDLFFNRLNNVNVIDIMKIVHKLNVLYK